MNKKFSTLLLTGKAATLPFLMQEARADIVPSYTDMTSAQVAQFELPVSNVVRLTSSTAATLCSDTTVTNQMSLAITGLKNGDQVFVMTSVDSGGNETLDSRLKIGRTKIQVPVATTITAPAGATVSMSFPLDLSALKLNGYTIATGSQFYLQTVAFPSGSVINNSFDWSKARLSELDTISVGRCISSPYGTY